METALARARCRRRENVIRSRRRDAGGSGDQGAAHRKYDSHTMDSQRSQEAMTMKTDMPKPADQSRPWSIIQSEMGMTGSVATNAPEYSTLTSKSVSMSRLTWVRL